jgi:hypothetical protein
VAIIMEQRHSRQYEWTVRVDSTSGQYEWTVSKSRVTEYIESDGMSTVLNYTTVDTPHAAIVSRSSP